MQLDFPPTRRTIPESAKPTRALLPYLPQLSLAERNVRWDRLRKKMVHGKIDALLLLGNDISSGNGMANVRYLLQVGSVIGADALFPLVGDPVVWTNTAHMNRPAHQHLSTQDWSTDFRTKGGPPALADEIRKRVLDKSRIGLVSFSSYVQTQPTFLHHYILGLESLLPNARFVDATALLSEMRMIKSEEEIEMMRKAGAIARVAINAMVASARPGVPDAAVYAEMLRTQIANGAEPILFNLFGAGPVDHPDDELWHLLHGAEHPLTPTMRPLEAGDLIVSEFHTQYGGYRVHTEFTAYLGNNAPKQLLRLWDVAVECLQASEEALVPGRTIREALAMIRRPAERAGVDWVELGFNSKGTASPEFPTTVYAEGYGNNPGNGEGILDLLLEERMTLGNNVDLHDSQWKYDVGVMLGDFMVVRPGRAEKIVGTPLEMAQIDFTSASAEVVLPPATQPSELRCTS